MAYRDDARETLEAPSAEGVLRVELGPRDVKLAVGGRVLHVVGRIATLAAIGPHGKPAGRRQSWPIAGSLVVARDVPQDDLGIWISEPTGMRRVFGVMPVGVMEEHGLAARAAFDRLADRVRAAFADLAGDVRKAVEIGGHLGKLLVAEHGDRHVVYARALLRNGTRPALDVFADGRILVHGKQPVTVTVTSRYGITVSGDHVRFAAPDGRDLARVSIPWIGAEDRHELARRIGLLVDRRHADPADRD